MPQLTLRLICTDLPPITSGEKPTEWGLQNKQQELIFGSSMPDGRMQFTYQVDVRQGLGAAGYDVAGPFVYGPRGGRFSYLAFRIQGETAWLLRWKIQLSEIPPTHISVALATPNGVLTAMISLKRTGTVRPIEGWSL